MLEQQQKKKEQQIIIYKMATQKEMKLENGNDEKKYEMMTGTYY